MVRVHRLSTVVRPGLTGMGLNHHLTELSTSGVGYDTGSYSEIAVAQQEDWTPELVLRRGLEMPDFLEIRWGVDLGTRAQKLRYLGLDFLQS